jgi:hypothetical protein
MGGASDRHTRLRRPSLDRNDLRAFAVHPFGSSANNLEMLRASFSTAGIRD